MRTSTFAPALTALFLCALPVAAQTLPPCKAGLEVPRVCCTNYPGTILDVDEANGTYQVKQQNGLVVWMEAGMLKTSCVGIPPKPVTESFFVGKWSTFVPPYPRYEVSGSNTYLVVGPGAASLPIEFRADGTYVWTMKSQPAESLKGRWRVLVPNEYKYGTKPNNAPVILLMQGVDGADWQVSRKLPAGSLANVHQIHIERKDMGLTYSGTRMQ